MNKKYDNNNIIIASRAYFHQAKPPIFPDTKTESRAETEEGQEADTP
jgi:hypothetical protein